MMLASFNALGESRRPQAQKRRRAAGKSGSRARGLRAVEISPRTLQSLRDRRLIGYSQMNPSSITGRRRSGGLFRLSARSIPMENDSVFINHLIRCYDEREQRGFLNGGRAGCHRDTEYAQRLQMALRIFESYRPPLDGEHYLTDREGGNAPGKPPHLAGVSQQQDAALYPSGR